MNFHRAIYIVGYGDSQMLEYWGDSDMVIH